jgi:hypothetical protein
MGHDWKQAVVHLECAGDSLSSEEREKHWFEQIDRLQAGTITSDEYHDEMEKHTGKSRDRRFHGSAVFLRDGVRRYLVTARHVLFDELNSKRSGEPDDLTSIFPIIFRVPSFDEVRRFGEQALRLRHLMALGAGPYGVSAYVFDHQNDLAVISLDSFEPQGVKFANQLEQHGYHPLPLEAVGDGPTSEGAEVFTVGFPDAVSLLCRLPIDSGTAAWASDAVSLPTFSFGRVGMSHPDLPFFWADMTIFPGNSGGPVVEEDRLVGIVTNQPSLQGELDGSPFEYRVPFCCAIKAKFIRDLIGVLVARDSLLAGLRTQAPASCCRELGGSPAGCDAVGTVATPARPPVCAIRRYVLGANLEPMGRTTPENGGRLRK